MSGEHALVRAEIDSPAKVVYDLLTDLHTWPWLFPWILHTERLAGDGTEDIVRYWGVTADETIRTWVSSRRLDPARLRMDFTQQGSVGEVTRLSGSWTCVELPGGGTRVESDHEFEVGEGVSKEKVAAMFAGRGEVQVARLRECAERQVDVERRMLSFVDKMFIAADADTIFTILEDAGAWAERLPGVQRSDVVRSEADVRFVELETAAGASRSARLSLAEKRKVVWKQLAPADGLGLRAGHWECVPTPEGTIVHATQLAIIEPSAEPVEQARRRVRRDLTGESVAFLTEVKETTES
ncbi:SRPBCC family protein [Amycolatopsis sp. NPDC089917]|uniref:aromatase/cyclase n=1 Tax=Amycolatopsis sp. NPDC089917 TaxID=3155187 RepID=UPI0034486FD4